MRFFAKVRSATGHDTGAGSWSSKAPRTGSRINIASPATNSPGKPTAMNDVRQPKCSPKKPPNTKPMAEPTGMAT